VDDVANSAPTKAWTLYSNRQRWIFLAILFLVSTSNYLDRNIIGILLVPIKHEFHVSDSLLGLLSGFSFAVFYAFFGLPVALWADRGNRRTIITLALAVWSAMTICCGIAQSFVQLALARIGVGAGESGAIPPAQSLIADYFPPERRAFAFAIFMLSASAGYLLGFVVGGQMAVHYGWRSGFLASGIPGVGLAILTLVVLREPRTVIGFQSVNREDFRAVLRALFAKKTFQLSLVGLTLYFFFAYGALVFAPMFLVRVLKVPLGTVSLAYGAVVTVAAITGNLGGGYFADFLALRDVRWLSWIPAAAFTIAFPIYIGTFFCRSFALFLCLGGAGFFFLSAGLSPVFATVHLVCGAYRRAVAIACMFFSANLFGLGLGPLITGMISDKLQPTQGVQGLRFALLVMTASLLPTAWCFYRAGYRMPDDCEE